MIIECFENSDDDDCAAASVCDKMGENNILEWYSDNDGFRKTVPTSASDLSEIDVASLIHVLTKSKM